MDGGNFAPLLQHRFLTAPYPLLTLPLKASRNKFVSTTEILHRLRQNSCQCSKGGAGMHRHVIEEAYYVGGARFPPSTDWMYSAKTSDAVWLYSAKTSDAGCVCDTC